MLKKFVSLLLVGLLIHIASPAPAFAKSKAEKELQKVEKVRAAILSLGVGTDARIKVKLKDKTKLEGYIKEAGEDHFVIADARTARTLRLPILRSQLLRARISARAQRSPLVWALLRQ